MILPAGTLSVLFGQFSSTDPALCSGSGTYTDDNQTSVLVVGTGDTSQQIIVCLADISIESCGPFADYIQICDASGNNCTGALRDVDTGCYTHSAWMGQVQIIAEGGVCTAGGTAFSFSWGSVCTQGCLPPWIPSLPECSGGPPNDFIFNAEVINACGAQFTTNNTGATTCYFEGMPGPTEDPSQDFRCGNGNMDCCYQTEGFGRTDGGDVGYGDVFSGSFRWLCFYQL